MASPQEMYAQLSALTKEQLVSMIINGQAQLNEQHQRVNAAAEYVQNMEQNGERMADQATVAVAAVSDPTSRFRLSVTEVAYQRAYQDETSKTAKFSRDRISKRCDVAKSKYFKLMNEYQLMEKELRNFYVRGLVLEQILQRKTMLVEEKDQKEEAILTLQHEMAMLQDQIALVRNGTIKPLPDIMEPPSTNAACLHAPVEPRAIIYKENAPRSRRRRLDDDEAEEGEEEDTFDDE